MPEFAALPPRKTYAVTDRQRPNSAICDEHSPTYGECGRSEERYCRQMKKIEAVIPPSSLGTIRAELVRRGVCGNLTVIEVRHGETHGPSNRTAETSNESLEEKIKVELIVSDRQIDKAVNVILRHAIAESSDRYGHVTLLNVDEMLQITQPIQERASN